MKAAKNEVMFQVKKDALWKPLHRQFRRYIKLQVIKNYGKSKRALQPGQEPESISKNPAYTDSELDLSVDIVFTNVDLGNDKGENGDRLSDADNGPDMQLKKPANIILHKAFWYYDLLQLPREQRNERNAYAIFLLVES